MMNDKMLIDEGDYTTLNTPTGDLPPEFSNLSLFPPKESTEILETPIRRSLASAHTLPPIPVSPAQIALLEQVRNVTAQSRAITMQIYDSPYSAIKQSVSYIHPVLNEGVSPISTRTARLPSAPTTETPCSDPADTPVKPAYAWTTPSSALASPTASPATTPRATPAVTQPGSPMKDEQPQPAEDDSVLFTRTDFSERRRLASIREQSSLRIAPELPRHVTSDLKALRSPSPINKLRHSAPKQLTAPSAETEETEQSANPVPKSDSLEELHATLSSAPFRHTKAKRFK